jgi:hypothetical protein
VASMVDLVGFIESSVYGSTLDTGLDRLYTHSLVRKGFVGR